jgi:hypothetical protein
VKAARVKMVEPVLTETMDTRAVVCRDSQEQYVEQVSPNFPVSVFKCDCSCLYG